EQPAFAALARQLLQPGWKRGTVHLVYAADMPPLWRLLLERAWMAWLPALLALAAWLWMRTRRFGPLRPSPEPGRRALLEHVQAGGEHLWRYGRASALYAAVREVFIARLRRRDPLAAALDGRAQAEAIARRTGAPVADIERALQTPRPNDGADFRHRIARLLQLRQQLCPNRSRFPPRSPATCSPPASPRCATKCRRPASARQRCSTRSSSPCSPAATCWSRACPAWARPCWSARWRRRWAASSRACSSRPT